MAEPNLSFEQFQKGLRQLGISESLDANFLYQCFMDAQGGATEEEGLGGPLGRFGFLPIPALLYIANEHAFYLATHPNKKQEDLIRDEHYEETILSLALDKYYTNEHLSFQNGAMSNRYRVEISTIALYLNFILGMLSRYKQGDPKETLIVDIMQKGFSMAKCIVGLLVDGYETEAFSTWRTLHENECILHTLVRYGKPVIDAYLKHLRYALAFRGAIPSKEETDAVFLEIKEGMKKADLKSKDMKRFIEYGWLLAIPDIDKVEDFKLNFRDGVERCAGLKEYSKVYEMSSEIAHSSPLLIYSKKEYFYSVTMFNLYESFFRLEKVFGTLYLSTIGEEEQKRYLQMRNLYFGELSYCYQMEKARFIQASKNKKE